MIVLQAIWQQHTAFKFLFYFIFRWIDRGESKFPLLHPGCTEGKALKGRWEGAGLKWFL
jgi:hypothetical protein